MTLKPKTSCGIIYINDELNKTILVKKKYTYAFSDIIFSKYTQDELPGLIKKITLNEKRKILSLDFYKCWETIWTYNVSTNKYDYNELHNKFNEMISNPENIDLLRNEKKHGEIKWEFPKGRFECNEYPLICALREFHEETGLDLLKNKQLNAYPISLEPIIISRKRNNILYNIIYYKIHGEYSEVKLTVNDYKSYEIDDIKWFDLDDVHKYLEEDIAIYM